MRRVRLWWLRRRTSDDNASAELEKTVSKEATEGRGRSRGAFLRRFGIALALALAVALAGSQLFLPPLVERQLAAAIRGQLDAAELVAVEVTAYPALVLLRGKVQKLAIDIREATIADLKVEAFLVDAYNLQIDARALAQGKPLQVKAADSLQVSAVVAEGALNDYFWRKVDPARSFRINLAPEGTSISGTYKVLGIPVAVVVHGHFAVANKTQVSFVVDNISVQQTAVPRFLLDALAERWRIAIDLAESPVPLEVRDLRVEKGRLFVYGQRPPDLPQTGSN